MKLRIFHMLVLAILLAGPVGCTSAENRAAELYETGQFEEKQTNFEHAMHLYKEILAKYPDTSWADKARERLEAMEDIR
ncbi:MAG TPA: hypothetical protein VLB09_08635 [Nitrospiria bacterium]|nr:hypothetical protein [Nitrospiria bacterium]